MAKTEQGLKIRLIKHTAAPAIPDSGSYEARFPFAMKTSVATLATEI
jgi:hypothetical protein